MRFGFLIDPLETLRLDHDSTVALMRSSLERGHEVFTFEQTSLSWSRGAVRAEMRRVTGLSPLAAEAKAVRALDELDAVFLRKDPPVDIAYLHATQLVELASRPLLVNHPAGLRAANEKLFALRFADLMPESIVSRSSEEIIAFAKRLGGKAVVKPLDGFAGRGVLLFDMADPNHRSVVEISTVSGTQPVIVQAYLSESRAGDKRIVLLDGEPLGAINRVPPDDDLRANMAIGGKAVATELTAKELELCARLKPLLSSHGLLFVGIDVIGERLSEINVTSPTGLVELEHLSGVRAADRIVDEVARRALLAAGRPG